MFASELNVLMHLNELDSLCIDEGRMNIKITYALYFKIIKKFEQLGLVSTSMKGHKRIIRVTDLGLDACSLLNQTDKFLFKTTKLELLNKVNHE